MTQITPKKNGSKTKNLTISVLGKNIRLSCPTSEEAQLQAALVELELRVKQTRYQPGVHGAEDVLLMIALNLCNELLEAKKVAETSV